jgi:hypothetical protein
MYGISAELAINVCFSYLDILFRHPKSIILKYLIKTGLYVHCVGVKQFVRQHFQSQRERERERETDRDTERERDALKHFR